MAWKLSRKNSRGKVRHTGCYRDPAGDVRSAGTFSRAEDAIRAAERQENLVRSGTWVDPDLPPPLAPDVPTLHCYVENQWWRQRHLEPNTRAGYETFLRLYIYPTFGDMPLSDITISAVQDWVTGLQKANGGQLSPYYTSQVFKLLQTILAARHGTSAIRHGHLTANPCAGVDLPVIPPREVTVMTPELSDMIIAAMDAWYRPIPLLIAHTGQRWGEVLGMQPGDVGFPPRSGVVALTSVASNSLTIRRVVTEVGKKNTGTDSPFLIKEYPKERKPKTIGLAPHVIDMLWNLKQSRHLGRTDFFFVTAEGHHISRSVYNKKWRAALDEVGVTDVRPHDLRASNISWMLAGGADLVTVMTRVGHARPETTRKYMAPLPDSDDRAREALLRTLARYPKRPASEVPTPAASSKTDATDDPPTASEP
jgi:integrase